MKKYNIHHDFRYSRYIYAPITGLGVKILNYINDKGIKRMKLNQNLALIEFEIQATDGYMIPVKRFEPTIKKNNRPCIIYFHGGGFRIKASSLLGRNLEEYALGLDAVVYMVDYRLMPKHQYPKPLDDAYECLVWIHEHSDEQGIDSSRIAVAGASAGGNLAAGVALKARDLGGPKICLQLLLYPALDYKQKAPSIDLYFDAPIWNRRKNASMWKAYLKDIKDEELKYASPLYHPNLSKLPPMYIEVAEFDCLKEEGIAYAKALKEGGTYVELQEVLGGVHGYDNYIHSKYIDQFVNRRIQVLKDAFFKQG